MAMKFLLGIFSLVFLCILGAAIAIGGLAVLFIIPAPIDQETTVQIESGTGTSEIATLLEEQGIIINRLPFMVGSKVKNLGKPLQAGEFAIPANATMANVLDIIQNGESIQRKFTIPEGRTSWEIVQILNQTDHLTGEIDQIPPEGSLMPDTYFYSKGDERKDKIARMQEAMSEFLNDQDIKALENLPLNTIEEVVILASIVEKETAVPDEYAKVAGVFINRLNKGMPLQTDPTVIYGITNGEHASDGLGPLGRRLLTKDLREDSPYNTYTRAGLTPTPIANPGRAAIAAVLKPEKHDYLYFVADGTGGHAFASTLSGHNANVAKWRKIRAAQ